MSNIYIQEPPTNGKVILKTTVGDIEIEFWSKECPKTCRNFIQLCMENYYNNTIFHRVIPQFIVQGGDPTGTGFGGDSVYGEPFKDEFHQRLRFNRRGLVAMANSGKDNNGSQFFFTLGSCSELQKKHTIFAKVSGKTIFNMLKLEEGELIDERPIKPHRILSTEVLSNPFDDIVPRNLKPIQLQSQEKEDKSKSRAVKDYGLLSFGTEAECDEEEIENVSKELKVKVKSAHDIGDPLLSAQKAIDAKNKSGAEGDDEGKSSNSSSDDEINEEELGEKSKVNISDLKSKLTKKSETSKTKTTLKTIDEDKNLDEKQLKAKKIKEEIKQLQKELVNTAKDKKLKEDEAHLESEKKLEEIDVVKKYKEDVEKFEHLKRKKILTAKENKTIELLNSFRERLFNAKSKTDDVNMEEKTETESEEQEKLIKTEEPQSKTDIIEEYKSNDDLERILTHKLDIDEEIRQRVLDANVLDNERYDIYDPRNELNKRKREISKEIIKDRKRHAPSDRSSHHSHSHSSSRKHH